MLYQNKVKSESENERTKNPPSFWPSSEFLPSNEQKVYWKMSGYKERINV